MTCKFKPCKTAGGTLIDPENHIWNWEPVTWTFCPHCKLKHNNRLIPERYWEREWLTTSDKREKVGIMLIKNGKYVWLTESYHRCYGFPKGEREKNETREECAKREFQEETGCYKLKGMNLEKFSKIQTAIENITYIFYVVHVGSNFDIENVPEDDVEISSFGWMELEKIGNLKLSKAIRRIYNTYNKNLMEEKSKKKKFFNYNQRLSYF